MQISSVSSLGNNPVNTVSQLSKTVSSNAATPETNSLGNTFENVLSSLNESQQTSDSLLTQLSTGGDVDLHTVMLAAEENDVNFRVAMAIRDKLVDAYREVMRMSV